MKKILKYIIILIIVVLASIMIINFFIKYTTKKQILKSEDLSNIENIDCIIVLGVAVLGDKPSPMLEDRLNEGIELYKSGITNKILMSGDHG